MGFGIRVMPGVRISASSRGIRAGIGPRAARIHVGSGRTGFSTGVGPVTYYTSGGAGRRSSGRRAPSMAAYERQVRAAERQSEFEHWVEVNRQMLALAFVHRDEFAEVVAPVAPAVEPQDESEVIARHEVEQRSGIALWKRSERRAATARGHEAAAADIAQERQKRERERDALLARLDEGWRLLMANDQDAVFEAIEAAFEDNEMPAAPIDVDGPGATLLMKVAETSELIPEREVGTTPTGKPTHKRRTKGVINALYAEILASHVVATVKEAFAVAPGLRHIRILTIRGDRLGGGLQLILLYLGEFDRASVRRDDWADINVLAIIESCGQVRYKGQAQELAPLDTKSDPQLRAAVDEVAAHLQWKPAP
jgi:hypothetical protein